MGMSGTLAHGPDIVGFGIERWRRSSSAHGLDSLPRSDQPGVGPGRTRFRTLRLWGARLRARLYSLYSSELLTRPDPLTGGWRSAA